MELFDTHAHYDDDWFSEDREDILKKIAESEVTKLVNIGTNVALSKTSIELARRYGFIYAAVGIHPEFMEEGASKVNIEAIRNLSFSDKVVAIGEIGLDYHYDDSDYAKKLQLETFKAQIELALERNLPVVIHSRDAVADTLETIKEYYKSKPLPLCPGVIHCFSASAEIAQEYVKMGFMIGIGGAVTWKKANRLKKVVEATPMEYTVLETDAPYQTPAPHRGERNSSLFIRHVAEKIAEYKEIGAEDVAKITYENACRLYGIS